MGRHQPKTATSSILHTTSPHLTSPGNVTSWHQDKAVFDLHQEGFAKTSRGALRLLLTSQPSGDSAANPS